ncbi:hypothetical protein ACH5RR_037497 [Cinchona calisaya]|uniref:Cytochrome P450 n=1 Tax=Cinchona calisaya TaxID=153742 RepID=A0ABD2Y7N1_9GENT
MLVEVNSVSVVFTFALVILVTWAWKILNSIWFKPKKLERYLRSQGFKGNPYRLWVGDLKDMSRITHQAHSKPIKLHDDILPHVLPYHHHIVQKYGKKSFIWNGVTPRVNVLDPDMIRDILFKYNTFRKPNINPLARLLIGGLFAQEGVEWAKHRKIINPAFNLDKLKNMLPLMYMSCSEVLKKWEILVQEKGSCEVDVSPYLANLTSDVISRTAFGSSYEEGKRIFQLQKEQTQLTFQVTRSNYIQGWRFLPTKVNKRMKEISRETQAIMRDLMTSREKKMKVGEKSEDLLGIMMESNIKEIQENGNKRDVGLTDDQVIEECKLFYFAGQETTSNLLVWTMIMLGIHQNWQDRARQEVFQFFGNNKPDFEGLNRLKTLTMILNEVLRIYPPGTIIVRSTYEETKLGEITLPPGVDLVLNVVLVHHDTELWGDDAKDFNPERFSNGVAKAAKKPNSFFPFSLGPRICVGQIFAMMEAKLAIALILQNFKFEVSPSYAHAPFPSLTLKPRFGAQMILNKI